MFRPLSVYIGTRYTRAKRRSHFVSFISLTSMIGLALGRPVGERLYGSLALAALAMTKGASILRVHDVAETVDVVRMIAAVQSAE